MAFLLLSCVMRALGYYVGEALCMSLLFLPGAFILHMLLPQICQVRSWKEMLNLVSVLSGVFVFLLLFVFLFQFFFGNRTFPIIAYHVPGLYAPYVAAASLLCMSFGYFLLGSYLDRRMPSSLKTITFVSDRQKVTVPLQELAYVESRDREVWVFLRSGTHYRNKTNITQWENMLGPSFVRIHRSYLVSESAITQISSDTVFIGEQKLPISKKYRPILQVWSLKKKIVKE